MLELHLELLPGLYPSKSYDVEIGSDVVIPPLRGTPKQGIRLFRHQIMPS